MKNKQILVKLKYRREILSMPEEKFLALCEHKGLLSEGKLVLHNRVIGDFHNLYENNSDMRLRQLIAMGEL